MKDQNKVPIMSNELSIVTGVAQFDTVDADCITVGRVTRMTPDINIAQRTHFNLSHLNTLLNKPGNPTCNLTGHGVTIWATGVLNASSTMAIIIVSNYYRN